MTPSRLLHLLAVPALAVALLGCGGGDGGDEDAADDTAATTEEAGEETTTTEDSLFTGTTASTADDETTTTAAAPTTAPPTQPPATTATTASGPRVTNLSAGPADCDGSGQTTLTWSTSGAVSVEVSIDNENGTFQEDLPPSGSADFPGACFGDTQVYFVKAIAADGSSSTRSVTQTSDSQTG